MNFVGCDKIHTGRLRARSGILIASGLLFLLLSGCAGQPSRVAESATTDGDVASPAGGGIESGAESKPESKPESKVESGAETPGLSAELLYDLLLANIAVQRGQNEVAMESISRAASLSRNPIIMSQAVRLAVQLKDYPRVIELSGLMADINPDNFRNQLALANALFETGQGAQALKILVDLARRQHANTEVVLQSIASLLAKQPDERILAKFRDQIKAWPKNPELKMTAALLASERQKDEDFRELIDQTLQLRPGWETAAIWKLIHLTDVDPWQIPPFADGFLKEFPDARQFRIHYARQLLRTDQTKKSLAELETVLKQDPHSAEALFSSGLAHLKQENLPQALEHLQKLLTLAPRDDQARLYIAEVEIKRGNFDAAAAVLHQISSEAYYFDAQIKLATVTAKRDGVEAGIRHLAQIAVRGQDERVRIIHEQGLLYQEFKLPHRAKEVLDAGLEKFPAHPDLLYNRGLLAAQLHLLELHERDMRALIELQPDNAHAYNALGYTLADQTERLDEALELITHALEIQPNDPFILDSMGWVNFRIGNHDKAIEYLRRALDVKKDAEIAAHLGEVLWIAGNKRAARKIWKQGEAWSPDNATLLETLKRFSIKISSGARVPQWESTPVEIAQIAPNTPLAPVRPNRVAPDREVGYQSPMRALIARTGRDLPLRHACAMTRAAPVLPL